MTGKSVDLQITIDADGWPQEARLRDIVSRAVRGVFDKVGAKSSSACELSLLFTDDKAIRRINQKWRGIDKPTNVLSFPAEPSVNPNALPAVLGDIVFGLETISCEAEVENKRFEHHLSHLVVHGLLHIFGYDHEQETDAEAMEAMERQILQTLAIPDPYNAID
ncbi:MAG: rRNA maturation RNase YbeY [Rhizobiaceae bacterium]